MLVVHEVEALFFFYKILFSFIWYSQGRRWGWTYNSHFIDGETEIYVSFWGAEAGICESVWQAEPWQARPSLHPLRCPGAPAANTGSQAAGLDWLAKETPIDLHSNRDSAML